VIGTLIEPVPVTGLAANFSPMPRIAPPPLGREILGAEKLDCSDGLLFSCCACWVLLSQHLISLFATFYRIKEKRRYYVRKLISQ
jgi:hypothetical protein